MKRKIAYVNLTTGQIVKKPIPREMRMLYLGGRGINSYLRYNLLEPKIDPMSPENVLLFGAGLLGGIPCMGSARTDVAGKSPLTNAVGSTNMGGFFAPELRMAGFDHLVFTGRASKPVYLLINNDDVQIKDATHVWGKDTVETQTIIREDNADEEIKFALIGQAGENLVRYANVMTGIKNSAGRTGMGCLMGSKNLKAVAVRGTDGYEVAYPNELLDYCKEMDDMVTRTKWAKASGRWGTLIIFNNTNTTGLLRTKNFQLNQMVDCKDLEAENIDRYSIGVAGCNNCSVHCRHRYVLKNGPDGPLYDEGPEYTTQGAFGSEVNCKSFETLLIGNHLVNRYGLDTLEAGSMIAMAMELYEKGILTNEHTGGVRLEWGDDQLVLDLIRQISFREGKLGNLLADGALPLVDKLGPEAAFAAIHVKGMLNLQSDERATPSLALGCATSTRGSDHLRGRAAYDLYGLPEDVLERVAGGPQSSDYTSYVGKSKLVWHQEILYSVCDALGTCKFQTMFLGFNMPNWDEFSKLIYLTSGLEISKAELMDIGSRIYTIERMFNNREGFTRKDDTLNDRYFDEPNPIGLPIARGKTINREEFERMLDEYYELYGWDKDGVPTEETLKRLKLDKEPTHIL